jgi:type IX secretion system PorP/SprF family membrane protein
MKNKVLIAILLCFSGFSFSQEFSSSQLYQFNRFAISPAYAGFNGNIEGFISYNQQMVGIAGAPVKQGIDFNGPFDEKMGLGISIAAEQTGNFRHFKIAPTYSYKLKLKRKRILSFGINALIYRNQLEITKVKSQGFDPLLQNTDALNTTLFDVGFGILYNYKNFSTGISIPGIIGKNGSYDGASTEYTRSRIYLFHVAYPFVYKDDFYIDPMFILETNENNIGESLCWKTSCLVRYKQKIWAGFSYRSGSIIGLITGIAVNDNIVLNYSYDFGSSEITGASAGSHEVSIGFLIKRSLRRVAPTIFPEQYHIRHTISNNKGVDKLKKEFIKFKKSNEKIINDHERRIKELEKKIKSLSKKKVVPKINNDKTVWESPFILKNIKFGRNSDKLFSSSFSELNKIVNVLIKNPKKKVRVYAYTHNEGSRSYNKYLTEQRAKSVSDYLFRRGINKNRIEHFGQGDKKPIFDNNTEEGREKNKRIEIQFTKK